MPEARRCAMTIKDKLNLVESAQDIKLEIFLILAAIIKNTYDEYCECVDDFTIAGKIIQVDYLSYCRGETDARSVAIPRKWLDEGFDYMAAYKRQCEEEQKLAEEKQKIEEAKEQKRKEKEEYAQYLKLKEKYEGKLEA